MKGCDVICATNCGAGSEMLKNITFPIVIIDECA